MLADILPVNSIPSLPVVLFDGPWNQTWLLHAYSVYLKEITSECVQTIVYFYHFCYFNSFLAILSIEQHGSYT